MARPGLRPAGGLRTCQLLPDSPQVISLSEKCESVNAENLRDLRVLYDAYDWLVMLVRHITKLITDKLIRDCFLASPCT